MKFTDGYWKIRDGVKLIRAVQVRDTEIDGRSMTVCCACRKVNQRGDTLNEPLLTICYSSPMKDVIRVQIVHHAGKLEKGPAFEVEDFLPEVAAEDGGSECTFTSGDLSVTVLKDLWSTDFFYRGKRVTGNSPKTAGYAVNPEGNAFVLDQLDLGVGEAVYGLGERFTALVKNGQPVDIWNEDGGTSSEQAYKNIPLYLTNGGYGVFVNYPGCVSFEVASEVVSRVQFSVPGERLDYFIIGGNMKDVLRKYTALTGRPSLPPAWSFGLWLTTSFTTSYDEKTVTGFLEGMEQRRIPLSVFHFDCFWMKEYQWCDFEWDDSVFPNPSEMLKRLKDRGLKICIWINPYIAQKSKLFREGMQKGFLLKTEDGSVWQWDMWQAGMGLVDFTNPEAVKWYQQKLKQLTDMGVDCFKSDFGERIPTNVVYSDGSDPFKMHNYYTYLYNKAVYEVLCESYGKGNAALFARSATVGSQKFPIHWGGDCSATYASMAESLRGGLSLGLSGFGFWSHDISGFEKTSTPDLYKRWVAFGLLSSHSRLHGSESYRVPWLFDEEAVDVLRFFTNLKCTLMPYIFAAACEAAQEGIPVMRAMALEFDDPACFALDTQYMLGESLLIAPVFNAEGIARYYVPKGEWVSFLNGVTVVGGEWKEEPHGYFSLPMLVRPNSIIPVGARNDRPDYDYAKDVIFHVFRLSDQKTVKSTVYSTDGVPEITAEVSRAGNRYHFLVNGAAEGWKFCLRGNSSAGTIDGGTYEPRPEGLLITPYPGVVELSVTLNV
jgi:alpha-D-xyloside xylohydrolase